MTPLHLPPATPPAAPSPVRDDTPDTRPPAVRLGDPALRAALTRYVKKCRVASRNIEDVVQQALIEAWKQQARWPKTRHELEACIITIAGWRSSDEYRDRKRLKLGTPPPDQSAAQDQAADDQDSEDPMALVADVVPPEVPEQLRKAQMLVNANPGWRRGFSWILRNWHGETYEEIATRDGVPVDSVRDGIKYVRRKLNEAVRDGILVILVMLLFGLFLRLVHNRPENDHATPPPGPVPTIVAPPPPAPESTPTETATGQRVPASDKPRVR
ncbi:MAG TPA: sigma-70 family RNA polymerase sigma factor [Polyangiaceae bacterium]|nr:sigma-70 family RNA polymerase sigma factor [Polyangiaceae bacterium]